MPRLFLEGYNSPYFQLSLDTWRDILGGTHFKRQIPLKGAKFDPAVDEAFELKHFWKYGDPLVYGFVDLDAEQAPLLVDDVTRLTPSCFESDNLKALMLWDLSLVNVQTQFDRADDYFVKRADMEEVEWMMRRDRRRDMFHLKSTKISSTAPPWELPYDAMRKRWVGRLLEFLRSWPSISMARTMLDGYKRRRGLYWNTWSPRELTAFFLDHLSGKEVNEIERELIPVYCQGVFDELGILPVPLLQRPSVDMASIEKYLTI